jgi:phospholipase/carboxylesterase
MAVDFARKAKGLLGAGGIEVDYHESEAAHHIDPEHVPAAVEWLRKVLAGSDPS